MKKLVSLFLAVALLLGVMAVPAAADGFTLGQLSYLNLSEDDNYSLNITMHVPWVKLLFLHGLWVAGEGVPVIGNASFRYYDTLPALLMGLQAGEVNCIEVPYCTGKYLCSNNDGLMIREEYHLEKASGITEIAVNVISDGYSFLLKKEHTELRDAIDAQITAMKEDGTLQQLIDEHIVKASEGGEPVAVEFERFEGDPIKVGVTGDLPPMDYMSADGSFAGFNTAVLAEIGKRLQKNIELVQVDSVARSLALAEGRVDVVFWTRGMSETLAERNRENGVPSKEELEALSAELRETLTEEEIAILEEAGAPDPEKIVQRDLRDMPADTISTQPYYTDCPVWVCLKDAQ